MPLNLTGPRGLTFLRYFSGLGCLGCLTCLRGLRLLINLTCFSIKGLMCLGEGCLRGLKKILILYRWNWDKISTVLHIYWIYRVFNYMHCYSIVQSCAVVPETSDTKAVHWPNLMICYLPNFPHHSGDHIVTCRRDGVPNKPPRLRAATRHGARDPLVC